MASTTFGIYLVHPLVLILVDELDPTLPDAARFVWVYGASMLSVYALARLPLSWGELRPVPRAVRLDGSVST
jgi:surface polysaccharide O-acyltransferase-like enzyme